LECLKYVIDKSGETWWNEMMICKRAFLKLYERGGLDIKTKKFIKYIYKNGCQCIYRNAISKIIVYQ